MAHEKPNTVCRVELVFFHPKVCDTFFMWKPIMLTEYRWSFGGNRLQIKAETHLLADVEVALRHVAHIGAQPTRTLKSLKAKDDLLIALLDNEATRLIVWLFPLDSGGRTHFNSAAKVQSEVYVLEF